MIWQKSLLLFFALFAVVAIVLIAAFVQVVRHGGLRHFRSLLLLGSPIAVILLGAGIWGLVDYYRFTGSAQSAKGILIQDATGQGVVRFEVEGRVVEVPGHRLHPGLNWNKWGSPVTLHYPPGQPEQARLRGLMETRYPVYWGFVAVGALFTGFSLVGWRSLILARP